MMSICFVFSIALCVGNIFGAQELLTNPGFENGVAGWKGSTGSVTLHEEYSVKYSGSRSLKVTGRAHDYEGPSQRVNMKPGHLYMFSAHVRIIGDHGRQSLKASIAYQGDNGQTEFQPIAGPIGLNNGYWVVFGSDFKAPGHSYSQVDLYLEGPGAHVDFYVDEASLIEIPDDPSWATEANKRIEGHRKSNIHFNFNVGSNFNLNDLEVQIDHTKHLFDFGSLVRSDYMIDPDFVQYQNVVYHMFNMATIEEYKWPYDRGTRQNPDFSVAVKATDKLRNHGLKVRGHCMFWSVNGNQPDWVVPLRGQQLRNAVDSHVDYMTSITKGKLAHWDVNNEMVHGSFFRDGTGDYTFAQHMFQRLHYRDPGPRLFLNEYDVVASGRSTFAYLQQIREFKAANVGLGGVGVQSHLADFQNPNVNLLKARLDTLARASYPIWITELDIGARDEQTKANWYEKVLRMYFSHASIHGIVFWGFWDHDMDPLKALVHGYGFKLDKAGERYLHLIKNEWSTHVKRSLGGGKSFNIRGFQGDYDIIVRYRGKPIIHTTFSVGRGDKTVNINIQGDGSQVYIPTKIDPFAHVDVNHGTTSQNLHDIGQASSSSQSQQLQCVSKWTGLSAIGDDKYVDVSCDNGQVLTGCTSILKNDDYHRDGEQIMVVNGKPTCRAINGFYTTAGIQAVARCCSLKGLSCTYRTAGPSGTGVDDQVKVSCSGKGYPLGCSTWTYNTESDGSYFTSNECIGQNDAYRAGVYAYAACCNANNLQCKTVYSTPSGQSKGDRATVHCPSGQVMTGCNVYSKAGRAAGAYAGEWNGVAFCDAVNGADKYGEEPGVQAIATCCHT